MRSIVVTRRFRGMGHLTKRCYSPSTIRTKHDTRSGHPVWVRNRRRCGPWPLESGGRQNLPCRRAEGIETSANRFPVRSRTPVIERLGSAGAPACPGHLLSRSHVGVAVHVVLGLHDFLRTQMADLVAGPPSLPS